MIGVTWNQTGSGNKSSGSNSNQVEHDLPVTAVQTLTVAPEAPGLWSLVPFFPADSGPAARPSVPSASCSPSPCSRAETHVGGPAPPGSPLQQILR